MQSVRRAVRHAVSRRSMRSGGTTYAVNLIASERYRPNPAPAPKHQKAPLQPVAGLSAVWGSDQAGPAPDHRDGFRAKCRVNRRMDHRRATKTGSDETTTSVWRGGLILGWRSDDAGRDVTLSSTDRLAAAITAGVWLAAGTFLLLPRVVAVGAIEPWFALVVAFASLAGMAWCLPLYLLVRRVHALPVARRLPILAAAIIAAGIAVALTDSVFGLWVAERTEGIGARAGLFRHALGNFTGFASFCGLLAGLYDMLMTQRDLSVREQEVAAARLSVTEARAAATAARLETLRYQVKPAFPLQHPERHLFSRGHGPGRRG